MAEFLANFPNWLWAIISVLGIIAIVIIALRGRLKATIGDKTIEMGGNGEGPTSDVTFPQPPKTTFLMPAPKRPCGDCILILMGEREKFELQMRKEHDRILKTQMNFAEQKIIEMHNLILNSVAEGIRKHSKIPDSVNEAVQYKLAYGLLKDSFMAVKDDVRRSLKDNGFYEYTGSELSTYIKDRIRTIVSIISQYIRNIYPDRSGIFSLDEIIRIIEMKTPDLSAFINDVYSNAKDVKIEADLKVEDIQKQFGKWVDDFVGVR